MTTRTNPRRRGSFGQWESGDPDPGGVLTLGGAEAAAILAPPAPGGHLGRKVTAGAEAVRDGAQRAARWNTRRGRR